MSNLDIAVVVDPNPIFREGLIRVLSEALCVNCVGFCSLDQMWRSADERWERGLLLFDVRDDWTVARSGIGNLKSRLPQFLVVILSELYRDENVQCAFEAGARGYIMKQANWEAIVKSLQLVCLGERVFPSRFVEAIVFAGARGAIGKQGGNALVDSLSPREAEVLSVLCEGQSNKVIARRCGITEATVKVHIKAILRKLKARNRTEAALWAHEHRLPLNGRSRSDSEAMVVAGGERP